MQVHSIQQLNTDNKTPKFKGAGDAFLRFLATNQGVGANLTDHKSSFAKQSSLLV